MKSYRVYLYSMVAAIGMSVQAFAASTPEFSPTILSGFLDALTLEVNTATVLSTILLALPAAIVLILCWWGLRKVVNIIMAAFRKGKISV